MEKGAAPASHTSHTTKETEAAPDGAARVEGAAEAQPSLDPEEVAKFSAKAATWWDPNGPFKPLHQITPLRIGYIRDQVVEHFERDSSSMTPFHGLSLLDIGCGGGLASEPVCRLGAMVAGIDASHENIEVARLHAAEQELAIRYDAATAETVAAAQPEGFDIVLALEIIEHVADVDAFLASLHALTRPGGIAVITTLNRTLKSLLMAKIGAEYILRWLPAGTHDWRKFLRPSEIVMPMQERGWRQRDLCGMRYLPLARRFELDAGDVDVNYLLTMTKPDT